MLQAAQWVLAAGYLAVALLHLLLPARRVDGYCCDWAGRVLPYRLNGPLVLLAVGAAWLYCVRNGGLAVASFAARHFWQCVGAAHVLGLAASGVLSAWSHPRLTGCSPGGCRTVITVALATSPAVRT